MSELKSHKYAELQNTISRKLDRVGRALRRHILLEAAARIGLALLCLAAFSLLFDWWLELSLVTRIGCLLAGFAIIGYLVWRYIYIPFQVSLSPIEVANLIDRTRRVNDQQALAPQVASLLQLPGHQHETEQSDEMIAQAVQENYQRLSNFPYDKTINQKHTQACLLGLIAAILIPVCFLIVLPATAQLWGARWLLGSSQPWPRDTRLIVVGLQEGQWVLPRGEAATLQIQVEDADKPTESVWLSLEDTNGESETITMNRFQAGDFRYELPPVQLPIQAQAWGGDGQTEPFEIVPIDRPRITDLSIRASHPRLSEPFVSRFSASEGNVRLLPQSKVTLELTTNVKVRKIDVDSEEISLQWNSTDGKHFQTEWTHEKPVNFRLTLHSAEHEISSHPRPVSIGVQPDRSPRLSFRYSGLRQRITPQATIPFSILARDDFGIRQVGMTSEVPLIGIATSNKSAIEPEEVSDSSTPKKMKHEQNYPVYGPEDPAKETVVEHEQRVSIAEMKLNPGAVITFQSFAEDNCFTGRQKTSSRQLVFRVVKPEELFREILLRQQQLRARLRKSRDQAEQLRDKLKLAQNSEEAAAWIREHQLTRREVGQVSHALNSSVEEMKLNQLGGAETWQLIEQTVLKPLQGLHDREMEQQRQSLESLRGQTPESLSQLTDQQDQILKTMDQILNNMAQWDSFIDVVNQLNAVIKLEQVVRDKTEELKKKQTDSIFDK